MSVKNFEARFFDEALDFIYQLPEADKAKVLAHIKIMETDFDVVHTKILRSPIRELVVKNIVYSFLFRKTRFMSCEGL